MRQQFDKTIKDERVSTLAGTFDSVDVPDGWADMVVIAQVRRSGAYMVSQTRTKLIPYHIYIHIGIPLVPRS